MAAKLFEDIVSVERLQRVTGGFEEAEDYALDARKDPKHGGAESACASAEISWVLMKARGIQGDLINPRSGYR